ncbi:MAG: TonB-dependent receptor [Lentilitoribacter sp.]
MGLAKGFKLALMASVSIGVISASAEAQETQYENTLGIRLLRIVKGAGQDKVATDTPQAVTVLNQEDIENAGATTVGDTFDSIPGVTASGSESVLGESFNIRGVGAGEAQADEGRFIISVDGVDKNYQQYRLGGFFSDPELYKRVEVLRGPASSTLYGSGALAGTVLFETKDASDFLQDGQTWAVRLKGSYGSVDEQGLGSTTIAWRPMDSAELLLSGNIRQGGDYFTGDGSIVDSEFETFSGLAKGTFYLGDDSEKELRISYQNWQSDAENQQYAQTVDSSGFGNIDRKVIDEQFLVSWEDPFSGNDLLDLKAQLSYSNTLNEERNATFSTFFPDADFAYKTLQGKIENTSFFSGENWENYLTYGVQYTNLDRELALRNTGAQPEGTDTKTAVFVQSEITFGDNLTLIPGLRVDHRKLTPDESVIAGFGSASDITETAFSPKLAALYEINDNWNIFGSYAHTERFGTLDEIYDYRTGLVPGTDLTKEKSDNFEIGFGYSNSGVFSENDTIQFKTTAFYNSIHDYITRNTSTSSSSRTGAAYINIDQVELYGVEVEFSYDRESWFVSGGGSIIRGVDTNNYFSTTGNLNTIPPDELFFTIGGRIEDQGISYGFKTRLISSQDNIVTGGRDASDAITLNDLYFNWVPEKNGYNGIEFRASIENIFDVQYQEYLSNDAGPGQNFKISLVKEFGS